NENGDFNAHSPVFHDRKASFTDSCTAVNQDEFVAIPDFHASGIASVAYCCRSRSCDGTADSPEINLHYTPLTNSLAFSSSPLRRFTRMDSASVWLSFRVSHTSGWRLGGHGLPEFPTPYSCNMVTATERTLVVV